MSEKVTDAELDLVAGGFVIQTNVALIDQHAHAAAITEATTFASFGVVTAAGGSLAEAVNEAAVGQANIVGQ
jgi:hypothetical protein